MQGVGQSVTQRRFITVQTVCAPHRRRSVTGKRSTTTMQALDSRRRLGPLFCRRRRRRRLLRSDLLRRRRPRLRQLRLAGRLIGGAHTHRGVQLLLQRGNARGEQPCRRRVRLCRRRLCCVARLSLPRRLPVDDERVGVDGHVEIDVLLLLHLFVQLCHNAFKVYDTPLRVPRRRRRLVAARRRRRARRRRDGVVVTDARREQLLRRRRRCCCSMLLFSLNDLQWPPALSPLFRLAVTVIRRLL
jgi:hypothetical protein